MSGPPAQDAVAVTERLLAVQAQDPRGARLAIRARSRVRSVIDVERALTEQRALLITTLNRGTLHLVRREDYPWLHALTTPQLFTGCARRLEQEGVTAEAAQRGVRVIERALADVGPLSRTELRDRLAIAGIRTEAQALVHVLLLATLQGVAVRGPMTGREHAYALVQDWLGPQPAVDREIALAELARRYLAGHAPADERDLARWAGVPLRDARVGLRAIARELVHDDAGLLELKGSERARRLPSPRLLGAFDPSLLGWRDREFVLGVDESAVVSGGVFRPFALVGGRSAATWRIHGNRVSIEPFARLQEDERVALERDGEAAVRYLNL